MAKAGVQVLVDGPSTKKELYVPRHAVALQNLILTPLVISKLPRAAGTGALAKAWKKDEIDSKWESSTWAQKRKQKERRRALTDFERFKVMRLKKQVRYIIQLYMSCLHGSRTTLQIDLPR